MGLDAKGRLNTYQVVQLLLNQTITVHKEFNVSDFTLLTADRKILGSIDL